MAHVEWRGKYKKKNNFLRQAKRYGKKGNYGKGRRLSEEEYSYYMKVLEQFKYLKGEEKEILVRNFMRELEQDGQQRSLASNQIISRILDDVLPHADVAQVLAMNIVFGEDLRAMCVDPYASHVLQTLLTLALKYAQKGAVQKRHEENEEENEEKELLIHVSDDQRQEFSTFLDKVGRFVYNNLEDFVKHKYASHVVRTVLEVCSGIEVEQSIRSSQRSQTSHALCKEGKILVVPPTVKQVLLNIAVRFTRLPDLIEVMSTEYGSAVLQSLLSVLKHVDRDQCAAVVTHLIQHGLPGIEKWYIENPETSDLPPLFQDGPTTRLLEVMLPCCSSEQQINIFQQYFKGKIKILVQQRMTHFAVQHLLSSWIDKETFEEIFEEISEALVSALSSQHHAVIHAFASACQRLSTRQASCMKSLIDLLKCFEPGKPQEMFAMLVLRLLPFPEYQAKQDQGTLPSISLPGALTLQELLNFSKPIKVVNSLLALSPEELLSLGCDPRGSHVVDAYVNSTSISLKNKEKLLYRFKGYYTTMACSKHGSRVLEALWKVASIKAKTQVCNELVADEFKLKDNLCGKIIFNSFQVNLFKRGDKSDWQQVIDQTEKKRKMFVDLLNEDKGELKEKKHKKKRKMDSVEDSIFIDTSVADT
ncbi:nucleolar protein 9-like isoform X2 [Portunus trituberculatus]|uniref:nucleolar protein 9-like isoform X2 n=1 Tax=Portunus trituberculatus TaxID=210409 RepID=UPI001E1D139B|nr:nucleolar protein 9-like isoform X2 [Portunus trituberculatus]